MTITGILTGRSPGHSLWRWQIYSQCWDHQWQWHKYWQCQLIYDAECDTHGVKPFYVTMTMTRSHSVNYNAEWDTHSVETVHDNDQKRTRRGYSQCRDRPPSSPSEYRRSSAWPSVLPPPLHNIFFWAIVIVNIASGLRMNKKSLCPNLVDDPPLHWSFRHFSVHS